MEANAQAPGVDSGQATLTVQGYKANQGGQPILVHLGGCWEQEQGRAPGLAGLLVQGLELGLEPVSGTEFLANMAGMIALDL